MNTADTSIIAARDSPTTPGAPGARHDGTEVARTAGRRARSRRGCRLGPWVLVAAGLLGGCGDALTPPLERCVAVHDDLQPLVNASWSDIARADGLTATWVAAERWVERLLVSHDDWVAFGWCEFHAGRVAEAEYAFTVARGRVRHSTDAAIGLGYVALRHGRPGDATRLFTYALENSSTSSDAREGLRLALQRLEAGDPAAAAAADALRSIVGQSSATAQDLRLLVLADQRSDGSSRP